MALNELQPKRKTIFDLNQFALNGSSAEMEQKMLEDKHILGKVALLGQATAFYAKPNAGKTLLTIWLTIGSHQERKSER